MKGYIKSKSGPNATGPKYRTPDHFKGSLFSSKNMSIQKAPPRFNPSQFKIQHRGG